MMPYDRKCADLASVVLSDAEDVSDMEGAKKALTLAIQNAINDWLEDELENFQEPEEEEEEPEEEEEKK